MTTEYNKEISAIEYDQTRNHEKMIYRVTNQKIQTWERL
jgi:hypothetical protein